MSLNFIKAWRNDKWYNKRVLIWHFTLVLIKINYGQIGDQTGLFYTTNPVFYNGQSVRWKPMFFRTELIFTGFVHRTGMFENLCLIFMMIFPKSHPITTFITFIVIYSIIKPYNSFFVINRHIAQQVFILNGIWSIIAVGEIQTKIWNLPVPLTRACDIHKKSSAL